MAISPPAIYDFPPFFTKQLNENTWNFQKRAWSNWILMWCRENRITKLSLNNELMDSPLLFNAKIDRRLPLEVFREVVEEMTKQNQAEWVSYGNRNATDTAWIFWKSPDEWATVIKQWLSDTGRDDSVCTFYELQEQCLDVECIDEDLLLRCLELLDRQKTIALMKGKSGRYTGFKVLSLQ